VAGVEFFVHDVLRDPFPTGFDAVVSSLFLHHLADEDVCRLLGSFAGSVGRLVLASDLVRGLSGLDLAHVAGRLLTTSPVVHIDGPRSVEAAFTPAELRGLAERPLPLPFALLGPCLPSGSHQWPQDSRGSCKGPWGQLAVWRC